MQAENKPRDEDYVDVAVHASAAGRYRLRLVARMDAAAPSRHLARDSHYPSHCLFFAVVPRPGRSARPASVVNGSRVLRDRHLVHHDSALPGYDLPQE